MKISKIFQVGFPVALVAFSYALGVHNERSFPGDRWLPANSEGWYWIGNLLLLWLAANVIGLYKKIFESDAKAQYYAEVTAEELREWLVAGSLDGRFHVRLIRKTVEKIAAQDGWSDWLKNAVHIKLLEMFENELSK